MSFQDNKSLSFIHKILLTASLIVITVFTVFTLYNDSLQRDAIRRSLESYIHGMGDSTASNIQSWISGRILLVQNLAENLASNPEPANVVTLLEPNVLLTSFLGIYLGDTTGRLTLRPESPLPPGYDARQRPWYKIARETTGPVLTEPYLDAATRKLVIAVAVASRSPEKELGVVGGDLGLEALDGIINSVDFAGMGYAFLVSKNGKILVHPDKTLVMKSLSEVYPGTTLTLDRQLTEVEVDGKPRIVTFSKVNGLPSVDWYIGLSVDKAKAYSALSEFRSSALIAAASAVVFILVLLGMLTRWLLGPLRAMTRALEDIAQGEGDLTHRLTINSSDEVGLLAKSFNRFIERIHGSITDVALASDQVNQVSMRVLSASNASMSNSTEQSNRTTSVAAAINELGAAAHEIAGNAAQASQQASAAKRLADEGQHVVERSVQAMNQLSALISTSSSHIEKLNSKTVNIGQILDVITSISQQTNLLALNAAIEAARAGEAGRGFAVVADEVRNLAHRTQESARQVQTMIEELQVEAQSSVDTMLESQRHSSESVSVASRVGERLESVTQHIGDIDGMNQSVAAATEEQTAVVEAINVDIIQINNLNLDGIRNLEATLQACSDLEAQTATLNRLVAGFRI